MKKSDKDLRDLRETRKKRGASAKEAVDLIVRAMPAEVKKARFENRLGGGKAMDGPAD